MIRDGITIEFQKKWFRKLYYGFVIPNTRNVNSIDHMQTNDIPFESPWKVVQNHELTSQPDFCKSCSPYLKSDRKIRNTLYCMKTYENVPQSWMMLVGNSQILKASRMIFQFEIIDWNLSVWSVKKEEKGCVFLDFMSK